MNLEQIQEMWEKDSKIDPDNLHDESLKIPQLHSKYYTLYNTITLLREKARESYAKVKFKDLFPISLSSLDFDATNTDVQFFTAQATFKYTIYDLVSSTT